MMMWKNGAVALKRNTKNICTKLHENILNVSQKVDVICQNGLQNTPKRPPEEGEMSKKIFSTTDNKGDTKNTCTNFHEKIFSRCQENYVHMPK